MFRFICHVIVKMRRQNTRNNPEQGQIQNWEIDCTDVLNETDIFTMDNINLKFYDHNI